MMITFNLLFHHFIHLIQEERTSGLKLLFKDSYEVLINEKKKRYIAEISSQPYEAEFHLNNYQELKD